MESQAEHLALEDPGLEEDCLRTPLATKRDESVELLLLEVGQETGGTSHRYLLRLGNYSRKTPLRLPLGLC